MEVAHEIAGVLMVSSFSAALTFTTTSWFLDPGPRRECARIGRVLWVVCLGSGVLFGAGVIMGVNR